MGLADRFKNSSLNLIEQIPKKESFGSLSVPISKNFVIENLQEQLFEKIVSVPCWFEYDSSTQLGLIVKFLSAKGVKTPEVFAKILQHSILGFGVFDYYLAQKDISSITYNEGKSLVYVKDGQAVISNTAIPVAKVRLAVQNMINMSQASSNFGLFDYRIGDFWVQLSAYKDAKMQFTISKFNDELLQKEVAKYNLPALLSDLI